GEYAKAVPLLEEHLQRAKEPYRFPWQAEDKRFRCLIRLDRLDQARATVLNAKQKDGPYSAWMPEAILAAKTGDVDFLDARFAEVTRSGGSAGLREYYQDEDIGPLLKAERFTGLRQKYPQPEAKK